MAVAVLALFVVLTSNGVRGCQCPSCHYADAAQNCQCCIYRQLGKRSDPALTFPDLSLPSNPAHLRHAPPGLTAEQAGSRMPRVKQAEARWSKPGYDYDADAALSNDVMLSQRGDVSIPTFLRVVAALRRDNRMMSTLSRLMDGLNLVRSLHTPDAESEYGYST